MSLKPYYQREGVTLYHGDSLVILRELPLDSVDAVITDPPYGLNFMGKNWDAHVPSVSVWQECLRLIKPGGHLTAFSGTRTHHRMATRIEDAGFEIRDMIAWVYGSGFPKSMDVGKAIDKAAGAERAPGTPGRYASRRPRERVDAVNAYSDGMGDAGSALITLPVTEAARQWNGWGTALKPALEPITVARKPLEGTVAENVQSHGVGALHIDACREEPNGRWPANVIHDGIEELGRFFYCAKTSKAERGDNNHPTVKPSALMRWIVQLVSRPAAIILDPFAGTGSTGVACINIDRRFIGIEIDEKYCEIAVKRLDGEPVSLPFAEAK